MIVVSDSTPLITLMKAEKLYILQRLFGEVLIPETVFSELTSNESYPDEAELITESDYIKVVKVENTDLVSILQRATGLDRGEAEAIFYADENNADILLMDEEAGRKVAQNMNLTVAGSMGVLIQACKNGVISVSETEEALMKIENSGRFISKSLLENVRSIIHEYE